MRPVPILFLDHASALGGAEHSLLSILRHLDRNRWEPHLAGPPGALLEGARLAGVETHPIEFPRLRGFPSPAAAGAAAHIARLARETGAGLVYANTVRTAFYGAAAGAGSRRPLVWHMRDCWLSADRPRHPWMDRWLKRMLCAVAARVIANSRYTASRLVGDEPAGDAPAGVEGAGAPPTQATGKVTVIHNAIETDGFDARVDTLGCRQRLGIPAGVPVVGTVGRLIPSKGQRRFIEAMAEVAAARPDARFLVVGGAIFGEDAAYERSLHSLAAERDLQDRMTFTGQIADVATAYAAMDIFVQAADPEGFGRVNLEAMAMARPVVALAHGSLPEIVVDGRTGLLVPPGQPSGLARGVIGLLRSPGDVERLGAAGRARVIERFSLARMIERIERLLGGVLR